MTPIDIFSEAEITTFENPPIFTGEERKKFFRITKQVRRELKKLRTPHSQVGLLLHLGYFRKTNRFYAAHLFNQNDLVYIKGILNVPPDTDMSLYGRVTYSRHKKVILHLLDYSPVGTQKEVLKKQVSHLVRHRVQPKDIIFQIREWCSIKKVEMCTYSYIANLISNETNSFEKSIFQILERILTQEDKDLLDALIVDPLLEQLYPFYGLKKVIDEDRTNKIEKSLGIFLKIRNYYTRLSPAIDALDLPINTFKSYGLWLSKAKKFQIIRLINPYLRYLHLLSFIHFQFHLWQDAYTVILLKVISSHNRLAKRAYENSGSGTKNKSTKINGRSNGNVRTINQGVYWQNTMEIMQTQMFSGTEKLKSIQQLIDSYNGDLQRMGRDQASGTGYLEKEMTYYDFLEMYQKRFSNKVSKIIKVLVFDRESSDKVLMDAIDAYRIYDKILRPEVYTVLFNEEENHMLLDDKGRFRTGLCKVLFYGKVADSIKSGTLNLKYSYKYLAVDRYMIGAERWKKEKDQLIAQAGLSGYSNIDDVLERLKGILENQFDVVHGQFVTGKNKYLNFKKKKDSNRPKVKTLPIMEKGNIRMSTLFDGVRYVMLPQVLSDINEATRFINCFEHLNIKNKKKRPDPKVFFAGLIGHGCNLGAGKMGQIAKGVEGSSISNTLDWYFSLDNVMKANDKIVDMIDKMALSDIFRKDPKLKTSSSDGQKFNVAVPSLQATYSLKYFGTGKGVSVYTFINDKYAIFFNTVITASEREAPYVIDGLLHNEIGISGEEGQTGNEDIEWQHSTDTFGFTEVIFGITHLLNITFAPRLKNYSDQSIYGFEKPGHYKKMGYFWLPKRSIDTDIIKEEWDNILRLMTTIRLKEAPASVILKRLNSYARQNPLYRALKEFGRIIKTIFLLRYIDDMELRQQIQYQLTIVELSHQFARAIFFGRTGEFQESSEEQQKIVAACRMLIQNSIVLWNYLYISNKILKSDTTREVERIFKIMAGGAMITWKHVHLQGTYNFKEDFLPNFSTSQVTKILDMNLKDFIDATA